MSAYQRDGLSVEAYLVRVLAALCKQNGGSIRVKGELIDAAGEATALLKSWDSATQELVLTVSLGTFGEVFRVIPERVNRDPLRIDPVVEKPNGLPMPSSSLDDGKLAELEQKLQRRNIARMLSNELRARRAAENDQG